MTDYYVTTSGDDAASGSELHPWRTVAKVNTATLNAGDRVRFVAGGVWRDATLQPTAGGHAGAPISFEKWPLDSVRVALIAPPSGEGAFWVSKDWIVLNGLTFSRGIQGGRDDAAPSHHCGLLYCTIDYGAAGHTSTDLGVFTHGDNWDIVGNTIQNIGNSGMQLEGTEYVIERNLIQDVGQNQAGVGANCHAIYGTVRNSLIADNDLLRAADYGITPRYEGNTIINNRIIGCAGGIAFLSRTVVAGTTIIDDNTIIGTTDAAIFTTADSFSAVDYPLIESVKYNRNFIQVTSGDKLNLHSTTGTYTDGGRNVIV